MAISLLFLMVIAVAWDSTTATSSWRVINGYKAKLGQFNFMATFEGCSASILNANTILTAAHCICVNPKSSVVEVGLIQSNTDGAERQVFTVATSHKHPKYPKECVSHPHDIAVLKLTTPIKMTQYVAPIRFNCRADPPAGAPIVLMGFGYDENNQLGSLKYGLNRLAAVCEYPDQLCSDRTQNSIYPGDSGGPVVIPRGNNTFEQIGVPAPLADDKDTMG
jgi:secreted trypsin-like serine protease